MVHWPEVMVTYDTVDKILFSADAFGTFGALNGAIFADEVDFDRDYMDEARRYYTNIVGKYGAQVQALLKKASGIEISLICPLHGFVWRRNLDSFINKYLLWSSYTPEESGVVIAYASIYGNTANAAEVLSAYLFDRGVRTVVYDVSVTPASDIIAACFRFSHIVFAAPTYNSGIFVTMEAFLHDLAAHSLQNRTVAFIQNGSWAPTSGKQMRAIIEPLRNTTVLNGLISVKSALKPEQAAELAALADTIAADIAERMNSANRKKKPRQLITHLRSPAESTTMQCSNFLTDCMSLPPAAAKRITAALLTPPSSSRTPQKRLPLPSTRQTSPSK